MIRNKARYQIVCDGCQEEFGASGGSIREVERYANFNEWITVPQNAAEYKHYCPKCKEKHEKID